ncbi:response regulator [Fulvivirga imtechensis AK7]|uniref:Response regulator n=1 Tax=Fulvivirga imtechensis AK7 TaxID=1237149 RepID=L8JR59_9BACT|nr:response regulator transcription factor [Fulvivirga imtechensis]ELR69984.1 response regulator [Fulvivirga imtechensis AK7]
MDKMTDTIKIILADDHEIVRKGIRLLLESEGDIDVVAEASDGAEAIEMVRKYHPDMLIVDIRMPVLNGIDTTARIKQEFPEVKVLVLSMHDDEEYIIKSIDCGADGYLLKDTSKPEFVKAIHAAQEGHKYFSGDISDILVNRYLSAKSGSSAAKGADKYVSDYQLTKRERQILRLIYTGHSNKAIADQLDKSVRTIETHRFNIMKKLDVNNIAELLRKVDGENDLKREIEA